ncbi:putative general negative regulator of transcription subunit 3 [[Candida] railenensis]|uniref:General negative regulator of transcription subunit n=1 Tax=[Candida] railenensis TaxID=45579 RepID=A0A9P0VZV8_9ASCO|nr:putative general negative regulator of transcription subunit 3 [[Candida] railenensis]
MSHRKLQKEVDAIFKKINEGIDLFNYYYTRHEASNNDSQRDKLEGDLKKEIKKLQKFRDQIKTWQSNDSIEAAIVPSRLQEHRRLVEEAMERYKDVEKSSKMKSYSNQSIMLAALEHDENRNLTPLGLECVEFLETCIEELTEQNEELESEYEKLSQKKTSKKNSSHLDERKADIDTFTAKNNFHVEKMEHCIQFLKRGRIQAELVEFIKDDISFYIESNQEPDFIDDETLYDEIFKEAAKVKEDPDSVQPPTPPQSDSVLNGGVEFDVVPSQTAVAGNGTQMESVSGSLPSSSGAPISSAGSAVSHSNSSSSNPTTQSPSPHKHNTTSTPIMVPHVIPGSPEFTSPAIIKTLKPATAPSKPVGALKWATAAAGSLELKDKQPTHPQLQQLQQQQLPQQLPQQQDEQQLQSVGSQSEQQQSMKQQANPVIPEQQSSPQSSITGMNSSATTSVTLLGKTYPLDSVLSSLSDVEQDLFSDLSLTKLPPGIQDLILSFTASRKTPTVGASKVLIHPSSLNLAAYNQYYSPVEKPFLPKLLRSSFYPYLTSSDIIKKPSQQTLKPPPNLLKLQSYWNNIRTSTSNYDMYLQQIQNLSLSTPETVPENLTIANELTMVLFYGYYYGVVPLENSIAELCLFQLGWKPYKTKEITNLNEEVSRNYYHWFKPVKVHSSAIGLSGFEFGDYQVFDLLAWEIYVKTNFKFDPSLCQNEPSAKI